MEPINPQGSLKCTRTVTTATTGNSQAGSQVRSNAGSGRQQGEEWKSRIHMYVAQALIVFNVYGIPLSFGPYLEYYYTTRFPTTALPPLASIIAVQLLAIFSTGIFAEWINIWQSYRISTMVISAVAAGCQLAPMALKAWWFLLFFQGLLPGMALGLLRILGILHLASHYKNNIPLASMQSSAAGLAGAAVYTVVAWRCLRSDQFKAACWLNFALATLTLSLASWQMSRCKRYDIRNEPQRPIRKEPGMELFYAGYLLLFGGLFVWPTFVVLLLCSPPSNQFPDVGVCTLLAAFAGGILSSGYFAGDYSCRRWLGPVNTFVPMSILAAIVYLCPAWMPYLALTGPSSVLYGIMLGPILALHLKVITVLYWSETLCHPAMLRRISFASVLSGLSTCVGIILTAVVTQFTGEFSIPLTVCGVLMLVGGILMGIGRFQRCNDFYVII